MGRVVVAIVDDMFFASKIRAASQSLGVEVLFARNHDQMKTHFGAKPDLVIVDLHNQKLDPVEVARILKTDDGLNSIPLIGFFSHVQTELQRGALAAGYDQVIPRSVFSRDLAEILKGKYETRPNPSG